MTELICIVCPKGCHLQVDETKEYAVTGASCPRGIEYGKNELCAPVRTMTSTVKITGGLHHRLPVKADRPIAKELMPELVARLNDVEARSPIHIGDILLANVLDTGANVIATRNM